MMVASGMNDNVFWCPPRADLEEGPAKGGWYFYDETGCVGGGPYKTERLAIDALKVYADHLDKEGRS